MFEISEKEIVDKLQFDNPWWEGANEIDYQDFPRRDYFKGFFNNIFLPLPTRAIILMGPRRVGKTVMVYHSIYELIKKGIDSRKIFYVSIDTPIYTGLSLERLVNFFLAIFKHKRKSDLFIFFDEIQYLKNWQLHLKSMVDAYRSFKFVATGSAAAALKLKSTESGAGRFSDFMLPPLTFAEFLRFRNQENLIISKTANTLFEGMKISGTLYQTKAVEQLNKEFLNYLNYGGYPEAVFSTKIQDDPEKYIRNDIVDKVLLRDLPSLYGISDIQELNRLFTTLAYNSGNEISLDGLAKSSNVAKNTIKKYLEYLEAAFLIKRVYRIDDNAKHFQRAIRFKVYLTNPSIRTALFGLTSPNDPAMGGLTETAIFSQWLHFDIKVFYARWKKGEIDFVILSNNFQPISMLECKWSDRFFKQPMQLSALILFAKKHDIRNIVVTTKTMQGKQFVDGLEIDFIPSSLVCYQMSKNSGETQNALKILRAVSEGKL